MSKPPFPLRPLKDNLILVPLPEDEKSPGGIIKPPSKPGQATHKKGVVLKVGPGMTQENDNGNIRIPASIVKGTVMIYHAHAGWEIDYDGDTYVIVSWRSCEAMVNEDYMAWKAEQKDD